MELTPYTYEQILALMAENHKQIAENYKQLAKIEEAQLQSAHRIAKIEELLAKTDEQMDRTDEQIAKNALQMAKTDEQMARTDEQMARTDEQMAKMNLYMKNLSKKVGELTDTLGRFAEKRIRPRIIDLFKEKGIILDQLHHRVVIEENGVFLMELDLLLVNSIYAVVVEVKHTLRMNDIDEHIDRLNKLQAKPKRLLKDITMFGAVAGMIVSPEVEHYAIKKGLYVAKPNGNNIEIRNKPDFKAQTWDTTEKA
jgi:hypothetical protein